MARTRLRVARAARIRASLAALLAIVAVTVGGPVREVAAAAGPSATITASATAKNFVAENTTFDVTFANAGADTGYDPYVDLVFPAGPDAPADPDGIRFVGATYRSSTVAPAATFNCPTGGGTVIHPLTTHADPCPAGAQLVVLQLPFGSFSPGQPPVAITVTANIPGNAHVGAGQTITATPGFASGEKPTGTTPRIGPPTLAVIVPKVVAITKIYLGPESETATGPNHPRQYQLVADVATGATIDGLSITDVLPPSMTFVGATSTPAGATATETPSGVNRTLARSWSSPSAITGGPGTEDAVITVDFFTSAQDATGAPVLDASTGVAVDSTNTTTLGGTYVGVAPDDAGPVTGSATHTLINRSLAVQQIATVTDVDGNGLSPGDRIDYTLQVQVSDFFTFGGLTVGDVLGDGQDYVAGSARFSTTERTTPISTTPLFPNGPPVPATNGCAVDDPGATPLTFGLSAAMIATGSDGVLTGGRAGPNAGTPAGATTATITFQAVVDNAYRCLPSGNNDLPIDGGDVLGARATVIGTLYDDATQTPTGRTVSDDSATTLTVASGSLTKAIVARNGSGSLAAPEPYQFSPADTITYRLTYDVPSSDIEK